MSLLNIDLNAERALIAVDTHALSLEGGGVLDRSKLLHLPHANLVLASRGELVFLSTFFERMCRAPGSTDFDSFVAGAALALRDHKQQLLAYAQAVGVDEMPEVSQHEVSMVGFSASAGAMRCATWVYDRFASAWSERVSSAGLVSPWEASWGPLPDTDSWQSMQLLAMNQVERFHEQRAAGSIAIGGRLLLAELTRNTYSLRTLCDLP